ncbi:unnamed protein product [Toxocara canis]|uniref:Uncharacterized protein n=1 Tax=Toxocara canis TaxID=6265 RepID=A0A183U272_TOXCA|nr:unnamed protein product [Toxocara canis]
MTDRILVEIATGSTLLFALGAHAIRSRPIFINALFLLIVSAALCAFAIRSHKSILSVPSILLHLVFDGTDRRYSLLLFWSICVLSSLIFCVVVNVSDHSSTIHRKFFHLTISLIFMTGLRYDVEFVWLCGWLVLCIFIIVEVSIRIWANHLKFSIVFTARRFRNEVYRLSLNNLWIETCASLFLRYKILEQQK